MQGSKNFQAKMFVNFRLDEHIPNDNFYRILKGLLDLSFIKKKTQFCYASKMGRPSFRSCRLLQNCPLRVLRKYLLR